MAAILLTGCVDGLNVIGASGIGANIELRLFTTALAADASNVQPGELSASSVFADATEVSWSGSTPYAAKTVAVPTIVDGVWTFTTSQSWSTGTATNGPAAVHTLAAVTPSTHKLLGLWDVPYYFNSGSAVDMSKINTTLTVAQPFSLYLQAVTVTT
jgi:hypothetical protein